MAGDTRGSDTVHTRYARKGTPTAMHAGMPSLELSHQNFKHYGCASSGWPLEISLVGDLGNVAVGDLVGSARAACCVVLLANK